MKLNIGCGEDIREGYMNIDINSNDPRVICMDISDLTLYQTGSVDEIIALDVLEHFLQNDIERVLREWCRVLKIGGMITIKTPSIERMCQYYFPLAAKGEISWERLSTMFYGKQTGKYRYHYVMFSFPWMSSLLIKNGMRILTHTQLENQNMKVIAEKVC